MRQSSLLDFGKKSKKKSRKTKRSAKKKRTYRVPKNLKLNELIEFLRKHSRKPWERIDILKSGKVVFVDTKHKRKHPPKWSIERDKKRRALPPGKRISRTGRVYYEYRANRSDLPGGV